MSKAPTEKDNTTRDKVNQMVAKNLAANLKEEAAAQRKIQKEKEAKEKAERKKIENLKSSDEGKELFELLQLLHSGTLDYKARFQHITKIEADHKLENIPSVSKFLKQDKELILEEALKAKDEEISKNLITQEIWLEPRTTKAYISDEVRELYNNLVKETGMSPPAVKPDSYFLSGVSVPLLNQRNTFVRT